MLKSRRERHFMALVIAALAAWALVGMLARDNFGSRIAWINQDGDLKAYAARGSWLPSGQRPYIDVFSEYPQVATYLFAVPHLLLSWTELDAGVDSLTAYSVIWSCFMLLLLYATIRLVVRMRPAQPQWAWLLLLPGALYFTWNRFDILPAVLSLWSLQLLSRQRWAASGAVLALGAMAKWYLVLWLPIFLVYAWHQDRRRVWTVAAAFTAAVLAVVTPTLLSGGIPALMVPYTFHLGRWSNGESLFALINLFTIGAFNLDVEGRTLLRLFLLLQFMTVPLCLMSRIQTFERVVKWCALSTLCFILFAKFGSPQWLLWSTPVCLLFASRRWEAWCLAVLDLSSYAYFPVLYHWNGWQWYSKPFVIAALVKTLALAVLTASLLRQLLPDLYVASALARKPRAARRATAV